MGSPQLLDELLTVGPGDLPTLDRDAGRQSGQTAKLRHRQGLEVHVVRQGTIDAYRLEVEGADQVVVRVRYNVLGHQLPNTLRSRCTGLDGGLDRSHISEQLDGHQPAIDLFDEGDLDGGSLDSSIGRLRDADKPHRLNKA